MKPSDIDISSYYFGSWDSNHEPTFGQIVDNINKSLEKEGLSKIKSFAKTDKNGEVQDLVYNNAEGIIALNDEITKLDEL